MAIRQRSGAFQVDVSHGDIRSRFTVETMEQAKVEETRAILHMKEKGTKYMPSVSTGAARKGATLLEAFDRVWKIHWSQQKDLKGTRINGATMIRLLGADTDVKDINGESIASLRVKLIDMGLAKSTQNKVFSVLRVVLKYCVDWGYIENFPRIPHLKVHDSRLRYLHSLQEEEDVLSYWVNRGEPAYSLLWAFLLDTGFRISEALEVNAKEDLNGNVLSTKHSTKSGRYRSIKATSRVLNVFKVLGDKPFEGITYDMAQNKWEAVRASMGLEDDKEFVIHCLRHTCASRLVQSGVPLVVVQKWMGHATIQTTLRYAHLAPDSLDVAYDILERWSGKACDGRDIACDIGDSKVTKPVTKPLFNPMNFNVTFQQPQPISGFKIHR